MRLCFASLSVIGLAMIGPTMGHAGDLDRAWLRGAHVDDAGPSYRVFPPVEPYPAPPPQPYPTKSLPVRAAPPAQLSGFTFEFGSRIWYSTGKLAKDLFDDTRSSGSLNSRLTYGNLTATSFEAFGRADSPAGVFVKGFLGLGDLNRGFLDDEDFPPAIQPYSSTLSQQQGGQLKYGAADIGQTLWRSPRASFGLFAGYGFLSESTNAFGCTQIAGNPFVCVPTIPGGVLGISEGTRWQFARLGFAGEVRLLDRLKLSGSPGCLSSRSSPTTFIGCGSAPPRSQFRDRSRNSAAAPDSRPRRSCPISSPTASISGSAGAIGPWRRTAPPISRASSSACRF